MAQVAGGNLAGIADHRAGVGTQKLDRHIFNEAYLMHTSTSLQYAIIASCDVLAARWKPLGGTALVEESIIEALDFRRAMRKVDDEWGKDWWFKVWGPERPRRGHGQARRLAASRQRALARFRQSRHGLQHPRPDQGDDHRRPASTYRGSSRRRIPASIVTKFLAEHGVIVEKTGLYSFFIMFTIGITKGRWNTLVIALQQSRTITTRTSRCGGSCPSSSRQPRYERVGLRDLCQQIHDMYKANDVARDDRNVSPTCSRR
jgi:arginine/lysine/ornithine decarboxylase